MGPLVERMLVAARKVPVFVVSEPRVDLIDTPPPVLAKDWMVVGFAEFWL